MSTTAIKPATAVVTVERLLESGKDQLQKVLPAVVQSDRFIRVALTDIRKSRQLQACNPVSVCAAVMQAAQLGLEFGSTLGHAYLIPYKDEATLQVGYRGLMHLARRSGAVKSFESRLVYDGDVFEVNYGTNPSLLHAPQFKTETLTHIYAVATLMDGTKLFEVMTKAAIEEHRQKYASRNADTWNKAFDEMSRKTVIKRLIKYLPITSEVADALEIESRFEPEEQHDPEKIVNAEKKQMTLSIGESNQAKQALQALFAECAEASIDTSDIYIGDQPSDQQVLAASQILKERLQEWLKKSTTESKA